MLVAHVRPNKEPDGRAARPAPPAEEKSVVQRPEANEGGREEEERGSGIATGETGRLHDRKKDVKTLDPAHGAVAREEWPLPRTAPPGTWEVPVDERRVSCEFMKRL